MEVAMIPGEAINSDLGIVNCARTSLHKQSTLDERGHLREADHKLLGYLLRNHHFSPFAHPRLYFIIKWSSDRDALYFYKNVNHGGFHWINFASELDKIDVIKGSLYGWIHALPWLPQAVSRPVVEFFLRHYYPSTVQQSLGLLPPENLPERAETSVRAESWIFRKALQSPNFYKLATVTLHVKVPIAIARQVRTSMVGFHYGDPYVEGESFIYNEVSRRYVNEDPEFYRVETWRTREGTNVKQGSTDVGNAQCQELLTEDQERMLSTAAMTYHARNTSQHVAPEQLRFLLPQSMYTEFYWTGTLHRFAQWLDLRLDPHVQLETRAFATMVLQVLQAPFPHWSDVYHCENWQEALVTL